jgi:hypothetical protein
VSAADTSDRLLDACCAVIERVYPHFVCTSPWSGTYVIRRDCLVGVCRLPRDVAYVRLGLLTTGLELHDARINNPCYATGEYLLINFDDPKFIVKLLRFVRLVLMRYDREVMEMDFNQETGALGFDPAAVRRRHTHMRTVADDGTWVPPTN